MADIKQVKLFCENSIKEAKDCIPKHYDVKTAILLGYVQGLEDVLRFIEDINGNQGNRKKY